MSELKLTSREAVLRGGTRGPAVIPGDPTRSMLVQAVEYQGSLKMPPTGRLTGEEIAAIRQWVQDGAAWPTSTEGSSAMSKHWAFEPVKTYEPPKVQQESWIQSPIDRFILAKLEEKGFHPAPSADKLTLLRRAKFDLHGLPPTEEEIDQFLGDRAPGAFARLVERLLASQRYGEQWGRHWLDVARYADSTGVDADRFLDDAWRYRDYVIDSFNRDLPYDQFIREQLAGDLHTDDPQAHPNIRGIIATGFLALGPKALSQSDRVRQVYDVIDEQIDTTSKAFLGLTIACARCHDHKFDPITTKDYYSLASIFASTKTYSRVEVGTIPSSVFTPPLVPDDMFQLYNEHQQKIKSKQAEIDAIIEPEAGRWVARELRPHLAEYMIAARDVYAKQEEPAAVARRAGLREDVLRKWVESLTPGKEFSPWLDHWYRADDASARQVAKEYQGLHDRLADALQQRVEEWKDEVAAALKEGRPSPGKPNLGVGDIKHPDERFYLEVSTQDGPFVLSKEERESVLSEESKKRVADLKKELAQLKTSGPEPPPTANAVGEGEFIQQAVFLGGIHDNKGEVVPKQFPVALAGDHQKPITRGSGRKELAEWVGNADNPLTARVMVNRIWLWHFGEGLVRTPDNWGATGQRPTHPALLDFLAKEFVSKDWSIKEMHRLLMLSSAYQMSGAPEPKALASDPENRLWSRFLSRKLSFEEMRDALLAVDGSLNLRMGGQLFVGQKGEKYAKIPEVTPESSRRRSVYLPLLRNKLPTTMSLFDFVDSTTCTGKRTASNIAPQALYMMNSDFMKERARSFAEFLLSSWLPDDSARISRAYWLALTRNATPQEIQAQLAYLRDYPRAKKGTEDSELAAWQSVCRVLMSSNEFNYVD